jgi:hypothetical protein
MSTPSYNQNGLTRHLRGCFGGVAFQYTNAKTHYDTAFRFRARIILSLLLLWASTSVCTASDTQAQFKEFLITAPDQLSRDIEAVRTADDFARALNTFCDSFEKYLTFAAEVDKKPQSEQKNLEAEMQQFMPEAQKNIDRNQAVITACRNLAQKFDTSPVAIRAWQRFESQTKRAVALRNRGRKLDFKNGGELYYTSSVAEAVTEAEAQQLGDFLTKEGFFDGTKKTVQLRKADRSNVYVGSPIHYELRMVVTKGTENDQLRLDAAQFLAAKMSTDVFNGAETEVHFCDDQFETLRVVGDQLHGR